MNLRAQRLRHGHGVASRAHQVVRIGHRRAEAPIHRRARLTVDSALSRVANDAADLSRRQKGIAQHLNVLPGSSVAGQKSIRETPIHHDLRILYVFATRLAA